MSDKETLFKKLGFVINEGGLVDFCDGKGGRSSPYPAEAKKLWELLAVECTAPAPQPNQLAEALADLLQSMEGFRQGALSPGKLRIAMQKANDLLQPDLDEKNDLDTLRERDQRFDNSEEVKELRELNYRLQQLLSKREATPQVTPSEQTWPCTGCGKDHKQFEACFAVEGTSEQASPTPDHQRVGESAGEWIARCGMETVDRILTEERRKYGVGEVERG